MSLFANIMWSCLLWVVIQGGLTLAVQHFLGSTDALLRRGILLVTTVLVTVISMAFF